MTNDIIERCRTALLSGIDLLQSQQKGSLRDLWRAALGLEHIVLSDLLTQDEEQIALESLDPVRKETCQHIFSGLETLIENSFASLVLGGGESLVLRAESITENYLSLYEELARREIALSGMTSGDRVLFVGSGPFPITAIEYHRQTGCAIECVDCLTEAVNTSRIVLDRLGLNGGISCRQARGESVSAAPFSVVLVGVLARPKQEILDNIVATCPQGCRILARTTFGLRQLIYQPAVFDAGRLQGVQRRGTSCASGDQVLSSILYVRNG